MKDYADRADDAINLQTKVIADQSKEIKTLRRQVEHLHRSCVRMGQHLPDTDEANKAYTAFEQGVQS